MDSQFTQSKLIIPFEKLQPNLSLLADMIGPINEYLFRELPPNKPKTKCEKEGFIA